MDRRLPLPVFGNAPNDYDRSFLDDLSRKLNQLMTLLKAPGEGRNTTIVLTNLATNDYGLEPGTIFQADGVLRVALANAPYVGGLSATGSVGSVTVTTV